MSENTIGGIIAVVITGLFTLLIAIRKERKEDLKERQHELQKRFENRPEFAVVDYKDYLSRAGYGIKQKCDIELFVAHMEELDKDNYVGEFRAKDLNPSEWCCVKYTLKNMGNTDVVALSLIITCKENICIFPCANVKELTGRGMPRYMEFYDRKIRVGETITIKLCYHKDRVIGGFFSAIMLIALEDSNKHYWHQPFFSPENKLYDSYEVDAREYYSYIRNTFE